MTTAYPSGDTIKVRATFRDYAVAPAVGSVVDPDTVEINIYDGDEVLLENIPDGDPAIVRESAGVYSYDWILPEIDGNYYIEFYGVTDSKPAIRRHKIKTKWNEGA